MSRFLHSYKLSPAILLKLNEGGFSTVEDIKEIRPLDLSKEINITQEDALNVLKIVFPELHGDVTNQRRTVKTTSLSELIAEENSCRPIVSFCEKLDDMLGGGIPLGKLTEICGAPGTGKTQLCLQLCVDVQLPECVDGIGGEALFIDTEGSFTVNRLREIAEGTIDHYNFLVTRDDSASEGSFNLTSILNGVHYYGAQSHVQLLAMVNLLPEFISQHPKIKLIVVDSIAFPFRYEFDSNRMSLRTRILNSMAQSLMQIATNHRIAVVVTNQMTTKVESEGVSHLIPALGDSWGHTCTARLILFWKNTKRCAKLFKSSWRPESTINFQVTSTGIRDVIEDFADDNTNQAKRFKT